MQNVKFEKNNTLGIFNREITNKVQIIFCEPTLQQLDILWLP